MPQTENDIVRQTVTDLMGVVRSDIPAEEKKVLLIAIAYAFERITGFNATQLLAIVENTSKKYFEARRN